MPQAQDARAGAGSPEAAPAGVAPPHRSVSQVHQYERCAYSYKLGRIDKVWERPAAWLAQGSAVHDAHEAWELSRRQMPLDAMEDVYRAAYGGYIDSMLESTPNIDWWFPSGPYEPMVDIERRFGIGLEQVAKIPAWYASHPEEVLWIAPDGTPGVELSFDIDLDGIRVRGYIDAIIDNGEEIIVRDVKTGTQPGDDFQLGTYAVALSKEHDLLSFRGDYWMARTGKPTIPYDLRYWGEERVTEVFHEVNDAIERGDFPPVSDPKICRMCSVAWACPHSAG